MVLSYKIGLHYKLFLSKLDSLSLSSSYRYRPFISCKFMHYFFKSFRWPGFKLKLINPNFYKSIVCLPVIIELGHPMQLENSPGSECLWDRVPSDHLVYSNRKSNQRLVKSSQPRSGVTHHNSNGRKTIVVHLNLSWPQV